MKILLHEDDKYFLLFVYGEELFEELIAFAAKENIQAAYFNVFGASKEIVLCYYDTKAQKYLDFPLVEDFEIVGINGSISLFNDQTIVHMHGLFADKNLQVKGGHLKKLVVSVTTEVMLTKFKGKLTRSIDKVTGLPLL